MYFRIDFKISLMDFKACIMIYSAKTASREQFQRKAFWRFLTRFVEHIISNTRYILKLNPPITVAGQCLE